MRYRWLTLTAAALLTLCIFTSFRRQATEGAYDPDVLRAEGYGGAIRLRLTAGNDGRITGLKTLTHNETPSYVGDLNLFLRQFIGKGPSDPLVLGRDIDGISRATVTSTGINRAIRERLQPSGPHNPGTVNPLPAMISLYLLTLATTALLSKSSLLRWLAMLGGFVYFGLVERSMLSIIQVINSAMLHFPELTVNTIWLICLGLGFIPTLIIGRIYCGSLCPFALVQEILARLLPLKHRPAKLSAAEARAGKTVKYLVALALIAICLILGNAAPANIEPFITLFTLHPSPVALSILALMIVLGIFYFRFWCLYLCPVGALTGLTARWSLFKPAASKECLNCRICSGKCPTQAIERSTSGELNVDMAECIMCGECLNDCQSRQIKKGCIVLKYKREKK